VGRAVSTEEFAEICLALQNKGAENVNIVTGSHAVPALAGGITAAKAEGLNIPVVWNSSGYENPETLDLLDGLVDIWLPDLKTLDTALAERLFNAPDYPSAAVSAILRMLAGPGKVIIRHLILPGYLESTRAVLRWFAENAAGNGALLSLMSQYTPITMSNEQVAMSNEKTCLPHCSLLTDNCSFSPHSPNRFLSRREYDTVVGWLGEFGIEDGFCQDYVTGSDWLPDFTRANPFLSELSVPVWHFKLGMRNEK
jgi:putative pyruvate formate lyase activating enzyme